MKKFVALLMTAVLCFSLVACGSGKDDSSSSTENASGTEATSVADLDKIKNIGINLT